MDPIQVLVTRRNALKMQRAAVKHPEHISHLDAAITKLDAAIELLLAAEIEQELRAMA